MRAHSMEKRSAVQPASLARRMSSSYLHVAFDRVFDRTFDNTEQYMQGGGSQCGPAASSEAAGSTQAAVRVLAARLRHCHSVQGFGRAPVTAGQLPRVAALSVC
jgi:hypothetical protein